MSFDVIVVGAGSMGMAAGYYLAKAGKKVALVDSYDPPHTEGSHHGETRIIRHAYGEGESYVPMALRASELWSELEKESGKELFLKTGVLNIGTKDSEFVQNVIDSAKAYSLPVEVLTAEEINEKWDGFQLEEDLIGCYETSSGVLMSEESIRAFRELAVKHGAKFYTNETIQEINVSDEGVEILLSEESIKGTHLVVTAGKGTNKILSLLDTGLPLTPLRKTFSWFTSSEETYNPEAFPAWAFDDGSCTYYGFPSIEQAGLKIGRHDGGIPVDAEKPLEEFGTYREDEKDVGEIARKCFSEMVEYKQGKVCTYTNTPDGDFIIDKLPGYENVTVACGFSGHGFKFSSVVGEILSQLMTNGKSELNISNFSLKRFT